MLDIIFHMSIVDSFCLLFRAEPTVETRLLWVVSQPAWFPATMDFPFTQDSCVSHSVRMDMDGLKSDSPGSLWVSH